MNNKRSGFTLIELSIVVLILGLLAAAALRYSNSLNDSVGINATNASLDTVEAALQNYRNMYGRLPCPAPSAANENSAAFGVEAGTPGDGNCTGASRFNTAADPDASDPLYDSATSGKVAEGMLPAKTLGLADKYAYDGWNNKLFYAVDIRITAQNAFVTYPVNNTAIGAIVVKKTAGDSLANALTYKGLYSLTSAGKNAHGAYSRVLSGNATAINASSANSDEGKNCHCNSSATAIAYDRVYVQKPRINNTTAFNNNFDDIVRFKNRAQLANSTEMK